MVTTIDACSPARSLAVGHSCRTTAALRHPGIWTLHAVARVRSAAERSWNPDLFNADMPLGIFRSGTHPAGAGGPRRGR